MNILVLNKNILALNPQDTEYAWITEDQILPKHVVEGASLVEVSSLPEDYIPGKYQYDDGFILIEVPVVIEVPQTVSPRQIRQALTKMSMRGPVETAVASGDQDLKDWWEFATQFERTHPQILAMAELLQVTESQLDSLFILAGTL